MYQLMLFLHLVALAIGFAAGGIMVACLLQLRAATTLEQAVPWGALAGKTEKAFPVAILGLFATGAYMTSDVWTWDTGWIDVAIGGLVVLALQGPLVGGRAAKQLERALHENGPGPLGEVAQRMTRHPLLWVAVFANLGVVFGIIWDMTHKPGTTEAIIALVVGYAAGALPALALSNARRAELSGSAEAA